MNTDSKPHLSILLASSSPYRRELLSKLGLEFEVANPDIDETQLIAEAPDRLVSRLSHAKCTALSSKYDNHLIIGSDQVATVEGHTLTKPITVNAACNQLAFCSGKTVTFFTGLTVLDSSNGNYLTHLEPFEVTFRELNANQIESYIDKEQPLDCAGSFKAEGLGIVLFSAMNGRDPNALIGLPLIALVDLLAQFGVDPLG